MNEPKDPIGIKEASRLSKLAPNTLKRWAEEGRIHYWKRAAKTNYWIFDRTEILAKCTLQLQQPTSVAS